ncbi:hypothetical protein [Acinetobacter ursingii]|uniref:hypothetical protein n=1 Tax=Acinetobacter ursingii TaxID=108980 RepID=UPI00300B7A0C
MIKKILNAFVESWVFPCLVALFIILFVFPFLGLLALKILSFLGDHYLDYLSWLFDFFNLSFEEFNFSNNGEPL